MTNRAIRCAIYTRKSTEEGLEQDFNSLQAQREACEAYIKSQKHEGWQLVKTHYDDGGFSGGNMERPALKQLIMDIETGIIDIIVVYKVDRLSRSLHDFAKMVEVFDRHKVSFVSVTQQFNTTTSMGRLTLNVLLSFAQFEREVTGERIRDKIAASKKKGMWMGGVVPIGYDAKDRKLIINPAEAETVRFIFKRYLELKNVRHLCAELKQKGIVTKILPNRPNPGGKPFSRPGIYKLLSNPLYIGQVRFKDVFYEGQHERIIDQDTWERVQLQLADNRPGVVKNYRKDDACLLKGKLFDAATGDELIIDNARKGDRRYRYYASRSMKRNSKAEAKSGWRLPAPTIEKTIRTIVDNALADQNALTSALTGAGIPIRYMSQVLDAAQDARRLDSIRLLNAARLKQESIQIELALNSLLPDGVTDKPIKLGKIIPMQMRRRGCEMRLVIGGSTAANTHYDSTLVKSIARAHVWFQELLSGKADSLLGLATHHNVSESYVKKVVPFAFLSPNVVQKIIQGKQAPQYTKQALIRRLEIPLNWNDQQSLLP